MLTRKQSELLEFLVGHAAEHDVPPSFDEMRDALGLASKSGVHRLVSGLEERGYIRRLANRARAIEILRPAGAPSLTQAVAAAASKVYAAAIKAGYPPKAAAEAAAEAIAASPRRAGTARVQRQRVCEYAAAQRGEL